MDRKMCKNGLKMGFPYQILVQKIDFFAWLAAFLDFVSVSIFFRYPVLARVPCWRGGSARKIFSSQPNFFLALSPDPTSHPVQAGHRHQLRIMKFTWC